VLELASNPSRIGAVAEAELLLSGLIEVQIMRLHLRFLIFCALVCLLPVSLPAQSPVMQGMDQMNRFDLIQKHWALAGKVLTLQGDPIPGASVAVKPGESGEIRILKADLQGEFVTEFWLTVDVSKELSATVEVEKKGFLKAHIVIDVVSADKAQMLPVTLRDVHEDPSLLSRAAFISTLGQKLKEPLAADGLSSSDKKDYARGVEEFLDKHRPERAFAPLTKALRHAPSCLTCRTLLGLARFDSGDWDGGEHNFAEAINAIRADASKGRPEPLVAFGVMESWRQQPEKAASFFTEALRITPRDSLALQELGRSQLLLRNWAAAEAYLLQALDSGADPEARLLRAEALLGESSPDAANQEMTRYLDGRDVKTMPLRVRQLWAEIKDRKKIEVTYADVKKRANGEETIDYLRHPPGDLKGLEPAQDQAPLPAILSAVGKNVEEYFRNFPNTSSLEQVRQEKLRHRGTVSESRDQKFHYLCFTPSEAGVPGFAEYRLNVADQGWADSPRDGFMLTIGFASGSILFHPSYQPGTSFRYLGRQKLEGRDTLVIAFAQIPSKARSFGEFKWADRGSPVFSQGLAWVDAQTYQVLRMRTDLLAPLPEVRLKKQTTEIEFAEVRFNRLAQGFWLPRDVTVTVDWNGRLLRNMHQYSDFKVFNVDASEKIGKPKNPGTE